MMLLCFRMLTAKHPVLFATVVLSFDQMTLILDMSESGIGVSRST
jgi:hypothetical protein